MAREVLRGWVPLPENLWDTFRQQQDCSFACLQMQRQVQRQRADRGQMKCMMILLRGKKEVEGNTRAMGCVGA